MYIHLFMDNSWDAVMFAADTADTATPSQQLPHELHKSLESFKKITIHLFMDYSRAADFADMQRRNRYNNTLFCCVLLIFSVNMHQYLGYSFYR